MPLILADHGYDIWMGNARGTEYSRGNVNGLTLDMQEFWAWSYAEMGVYDDTANIEFIKRQTQMSDLRLSDNEIFGTEAF